MSKDKTCHNCGNNYVCIGNHWKADGNNCGYIKIDKHKMEILTGVLMGDGNVQINNGKNPLLSVSVKEKDYLKYLDSELDVLSNGVKKWSNRNLWRLRTIRHPKIHELLSWYDGGEKTWDKSVVFTPTVLKHLYACDGSLCATEESKGHCRISICNESERAEKIANKLENVVPRPTVDKYGDNCSLRWNVNDSKKVLNYMGKPLCGYRYKWNMGD
jgi:hypothetical protein